MGLAWAAIVVLTIPAALGRCDPWHVTFNGMGAFLMAMAVMAKFRPRLYPTYAIGYFFLFGIVSFFFAPLVYDYCIRPVQLALACTPIRPDTAPSKLVDKLNLKEFSSVAVPFGIDRATRKFLLDTGRFAAQCHPDFTSVFDQEELDRKIKGLEKAAAVLVPPGVPRLRSLSESDLIELRQQNIELSDASQNLYLGTLFVYPVDFKTKRLLFDPKLAEASYIAKHFKPVRQEGDWVLMVPDTDYKSPHSPASDSVPEPPTREGNEAAAIKKLTAALDSSVSKGKPGYAAVYNKLGTNLSGRGQFDEAIAQFRKALEIKPDYAEAHYNLGMALAGHGQVDEAIEHYRKALETNPDYVEAHNNLGMVLAGRGQVDEAIAHFQKVLEIKPNSAEAHNNLGIFLASRGQLDEAIAHYQKALKIKPDSAETHNNLGFALAGQGQVDEAIVHYRTAIEMKPDYAEAHVNLGNALHGRGQIDEAIAHYQKALKIKPDYPDAGRNLEAALSERERIMKALAERRELLRSRPKDATLLNDTAWLLATNPNVSVRNGTEAVELAQRAVDLSGGQNRPFSERWPPRMPRQDGLPRQCKPPTRLWTSPRNRTSRPWPNPSGPRFGSTKPAGLFTSRPTRLPRPQFDLNVRLLCQVSRCFATSKCLPWLGL